MSIVLKCNTYFVMHYSVIFSGSFRSIFVYNTEIVKYTKTFTCPKYFVWKSLVINFILTQMSRMAMGSRTRAVKAMDTVLDGLTSGSRNICYKKKITQIVHLLFFINTNFFFYDYETSIYIQIMIIIFCNNNNKFIFQM